MQGIKNYKEIDDSKSQPSTVQHDQKTIPTLTFSDSKVLIPLHILAESQAVSVISTYKTKVEKN